MTPPNSERRNLTLDDFLMRPTRPLYTAAHVEQLYADRFLAASIISHLCNRARAASGSPLIMSKPSLTETQTAILRKLEAGHRIVYSRDGDCGWISGENKHLDDKDIWALRNAQFIIMESDERGDDYGDDIITVSGRAHLASGRTGERKS